MDLFNKPEDFFAVLEDNKRAIATDFTAPSSTLIVIFGGFKGGLAMPVFEFFNLLAPFQVKKIFLRDIYQLWFHNGIPEIPGGIDKIKDYLEKIIDRESIKKTVFMGNSSGGYSAILFGCLLEVDEVHTFSPTTFLGPFKRVIYYDLHYWKKLLELYRCKNSQYQYFDLRSLLQRYSGETEYHLHYSKGQRRDIRHICQLEGMPQCIQHAYDYNQHDLIRHLKVTGELENLLLKIFNK